MTLVPQLQEIAEQIARGDEPEPVTVRTLLSWYGAKRRGFYIVHSIRQELEAANLITQPNFEYAYIDSPIWFAPASQESANVAQKVEEVVVIQASEAPSTDASVGEASIVVGYVSGASGDPTFRIGQLVSANRPPVYVKPDATLREATTLMMLHDFSQLPVMQNDREVKGVISWRSIGKRAALGVSSVAVREAMEVPAPEVSATVSLFSAIPLVVEHGYVLVRQSDRRVSGIVTTSDLSLQFRQLAEPFLLVGEIENYIRRIIDGKFTKEELAAARDPNNHRPINSVADLAFAEYIRLLENPAYWANLGLYIDRAAFIDRLDRIRLLRNDIMHFDPDPFAEEELELLRSFAGFMRDLAPHA